MTVPHDELIRIRLIDAILTIVPSPASTRVGRSVTWVLDGVSGVAQISFPGPAALDLVAGVDAPAVATFAEVGERRYDVRLTTPDEATYASVAVLIVDP